jgi:hypothetical protein
MDAIDLTLCIVIILLLWGIAYLVWVCFYVKALVALREKPTIKSNGDETECKSAFADFSVKATSHSLEINWDVPRLLTDNELELKGYVNIDGGPGRAKAFSATSASSVSMHAEPGRNYTFNVLVSRTFLAWFTVFFDDISFLVRTPSTDAKVRELESARQLKSLESELAALESATQSRDAVTDTPDGMLKEMKHRLKFEQELNAIEKKALAAIDEGDLPPDEKEAERKFVRGRFAARRREYRDK